MKHTLTNAQAVKFAEGYNVFVETISAGGYTGKSKFRAGTWGDIGFECARAVINRREIEQLKTGGQLDRSLESISAAQAQAVLDFDEKCLSEVLP